MPRIEIRRNTPLQPWTYEDLDRRQREIAAAVSLDSEGALLLSEVAPVITLGRRACGGDLLAGEDSLRRSGIAIYRTNRGGLATYHGPGQWVLFAVDRLERLVGDPRGVRVFVEALLETARQAALPYEPGARIRGGAETGVWGRHGKIASVGIHVEHGVALHGLCINGFRTAQSFAGVRPCGLDLPVQFLLRAPSDENFQALGRGLAEAAMANLWSCRKTDQPPSRLDGPRAEAL